MHCFSRCSDEYFWPDRDRVLTPRADQTVWMNAYGRDVVTHAV